MVMLPVRLGLPRGLTRQPPSETTHVQKRHQLLLATALLAKECSSHSVAVGETYNRNFRCFTWKRHRSSSTALLACAPAGMLLFTMRSLATLQLALMP